MCRYHAKRLNRNNTGRRQWYLYISLGKAVRQARQQVLPLHPAQITKLIIPRHPVADDMVQENGYFGRLYGYKRCNCNYGNTCNKRQYNRKRPGNLYGNYTFRLNRGSSNRRYRLVYLRMAEQYNKRHNRLYKRCRNK